MQNELIKRPDEAIEKSRAELAAKSLWETENG